MCIPVAIVRTTGSCSSSSRDRVLGLAFWAAAGSGGACAAGAGTTAASRPEPERSAARRSFGSRQPASPSKFRVAPSPSSLPPLPE